MTTVSEHYEKHLATVYVWMVGGVDDAFARGDAEIERIFPITESGLKVVDLGAGFGMHAVPLARRGNNVIAIDESQILLNALKSNVDDLPIQTIRDDLVDFPRHLSGEVDLILCMGDTLTHLENRSAVERLFDSAKRALRPRGRLVLTFRDYSRVLSDEERFIPVRSDDTKILTCFLEYSESHVMVHDILHEKRDSAWNLSVSAYQKLRLSPDSVSSSLESRGFTVRLEPGLSGMV